MNVELCLSGAVGVHHEDLVIPVTVRRERDPAAIGRPCRNPAAHVVEGRQSHRVRPVDIHHVDVVSEQHSKGLLRAMSSTNACLLSTVLLPNAIVRRSMVGTRTPLRCWGGGATLPDVRVARFGDPAVAAREALGDEAYEREFAHGLELDIEGLTSLARRRWPGRSSRSSKRSVRPGSPSGNGVGTCGLFRKDLDDG